VRLLIVRHAIAVDRGPAEIPEDERPLTKRGASRFKRAAKGLVRIAPRPDALLTSPLLRAYQTAQILAEAWGHLTPKKVPALASGNLHDLATALAGHGRESQIAIVGHEPHLSSLLAALLSATHSERLSFRKGGVALVECPGTLSEGGRLVLALPPRVLRALGKNR
jgi:phosphohistidine phosphatase